MTVEQTVAAHQAAMLALRTRITALAAAQWAALGGAYDDAALASFVSRMVPLALAAQRQAAVVTDAYLALLARDVLGTADRPVGLPRETTTGAALRNGTAPETVYARPIVEVRTALSRGADRPTALAHGLQRAQVLAETDVQLAQRAALLQVVKNDTRIVGYRRVLTGQSCGLCVMASTQRYHVESLMPIHGHCDCGVAPIYGTRDVGQVINGPHLARVKSVLGDWDEERFGPMPDNQRAALAELRFEVREHGELGPVLTRRGQHFAGPADVADHAA